MNKIESLIEKIKRYFPEARERAKRRKSPWNLILIPVGAAWIGFFCVAQFKILWAIHILIYPNHAGRYEEFWPAGLSIPAFISSFLLIMPVFISSIILGMIAANIFLWCIPPMRRIFDKEAQGTKGASFRESRMSLCKIAGYVVPICFLLGLIGAFTLKSFTGDPTLTETQTNIYNLARLIGGTVFLLGWSIYLGKKAINGLRRGVVRVGGLADYQYQTKKKNPIGFWSQIIGWIIISVFLFICWFLWMGDIILW